MNRESSYFARREYPAILGAVRTNVAHALGVDAGESAFARNATEALQSIISQYNRLQAGDTVLYADLDYPAMQMAMNGLAERRGATVVMIDLPELATRESLIAACTRARGVDTVLDAAHAFGQVPLSLPETGATFGGVNLHTWVAAPIGVAALYIRKDTEGISIGVGRVFRPIADRARTAERVAA